MWRLPTGTCWSRAAKSGSRMDPPENLARPAIDPLFRSAALAYGPAVVGAVLTGQLDDGTSGLLAIKDRGGTTIVQDPAEATAPSMPLSALRHVPIDHQCTLAKMAPLFVALAKDDPAGEEPEALAKLMEIESRIAEGILSVDDWWALEQMSAPSGFNCPSCRSALYELEDKRVLRFRCRSGHAFSALSLLSGQADTRESQFSSIFGALIEEATLAKRMREAAAYEADAALAQGLGRRMESLEREAAEICEWLRSTADLVEPEPGAPLRLPGNRPIAPWRGESAPRVSARPAKLPAVAAPAALGIPSGAQRRSRLPLMKPIPKASRSTVSGLSSISRDTALTERSPRSASLA